VRGGLGRYMGEAILKSTGTKVGLRLAGSGEADENRLLDFNLYSKRDDGLKSICSPGPRCFAPRLWCPWGIGHDTVANVSAAADPEQQMISAFGPGPAAGSGNSPQANVLAKLPILRFAARDSA